jgi:hypothetical protein
MLRLAVPVRRKTKAGSSGVDGSLEPQHPGRRHEVILIGLNKDHTGLADLYRVSVK